VKATSRVFVAGGSTLLGAAILDRLREAGHAHLVGVGPEEPDHTSPAQVEDFFAEYRPEYVFVAAGRSGGIGLNQVSPAELMLDNLLVATNLLPVAHAHGVRKLLYLGSSCAYPRLAAQPMAVASLYTGSLEPTSAAYASAKIAGMQLSAAYRAQHGANFVTAIPANAFGPGDDFSEDAGHVIPALMRRFHEAKRAGRPEVVVWGSGTPRREFVAARDIADAAVFVMQHYDEPAPINLGGGTDVSITQVARLIADVVGYRGRLCFDAGKPDGMPLKRLDSSPLFLLGWRPTTTLEDALTETYTWFVQHEVTEDHDHAAATLSVALPDSSGRGRDRPRLPDGSDQKPRPPVDRPGGRQRRRLRFAPPE
jgi:GDP-L-fucose synthase